MEKKTLTENPWLAVIGTGSWGQNLVRNFYKLEVLRAVCDQDKERLKPWKEEWPELVALENFEDALKDKLIKAVAIATSNRNFIKEWLTARCNGKRVLDYCYGDG